MENHKPVHSLVLDAGPVIKNDPAVSSLIQQAEKLYTVPSIIAEIRDAQTRTRVDVTLRPFLTIQAPNPKSIKLISDFARKTGDLAVLSRPDLEIIALTYDLECERNHGDWRLRSTPGQKRLNGSPPVESTTSTKQEEKGDQLAAISQASQMENMHLTDHALRPLTDGDTKQLLSTPRDPLGATSTEETSESNPGPEHADVAPSHELVGGCEDIAALKPDEHDDDQPDQELDSDSDSDSQGWITPKNLKRQQAKHATASTVDVAEPSTMQAAVLTSDFAMQNVILQMNLNLLSSSMQRVRHLKTFVLRCHACFQTTKEMSKQFCPRCGQPALTRVSCSTNANGEFKLHLKKSIQWNTRGDRFSVPKPMHGSANGRVKGGGKGGWGHDLILAEDQKEYERARVVEEKQKERSLMDEDYLPSILTGDRNRSGGRIKVGAGRNINSRKR